MGKGDNVSHHGDRILVYPDKTIRSTGKVILKEKQPVNRLFFPTPKCGVPGDAGIYKLIQGLPKMSALP